MTYCPLQYGVIAWLEIKSTSPKAAPLPITETGYLSHYHQPSSIEAKGGDVVKVVTDWLNKEAAKPEWKKHLEESKQYSLF